MKYFTPVYKQAAFSESRLIQKKITDNVALLKIHSITFSTANYFNINTVKRLFTYRVASMHYSNSNDITHGVVLNA